MTRKRLPANGSRRGTTTTCRRSLPTMQDAIVFHSPRIRLVTGQDADVVRGKAALGDYWNKALSQSRELFFEVDQVLTGSDAIDDHLHES